MKKRIVMAAGKFDAGSVVAFVVLCMAGVVARLVRGYRAPDEPDQIVVGMGLHYEPVQGRFPRRHGRIPPHRDGSPRGLAGAIWLSYGSLVCETYTAGDGDAAKALATRIDSTVVAGIDSPARAEPAVTALLGAIDTSSDSDTAFNTAAEAVRPLLDYLIRDEHSRMQADEAAAIQVSSTAPAGSVLEREGVKYLVYPFSKGWMCRGVRLDDSDESAAMPVAWHGKEGEELQRLSGMPDALKCLRSVISATSRESAVRMALRLYREHSAQ